MNKNDVREKLYNELTGGKPIEQVLEDSHKKMAEIYHPNTVNYYDVTKSECGTTVGHVYIPASKGKGKLFYSSWVSYVKERVRLNAYQAAVYPDMKKEAVMSYEVWMKKRVRTFFTVTGLLSLSVVGLIGLFYI